MSDPTGRQSGDELLQLAYGPQTPDWPVRDTPSRRTTIAYIADKLRLKGADPRTSYRDLTIDFGSDDYAGRLRSMEYPGEKVLPSADDFRDVKAELLHEFTWVTKVRSYLGELRTILTESAIIKQGELGRVAERVRQQVGLGDKEGAAMNAFDVYGELFTVAGKIGVEGAGPIGGAFKVAGLLTKSKGGSVLADINGNATELASDLSQTYEKSLIAVGILRSILLTDAGKLRTAGENVIAEKPGWFWDDSSIARTRRGLTFAATRAFTRSFMRVVWRTYELPQAFQDPNGCRVLRGEPASAWFSSTGGFAASGSGVTRTTTALAIGKRTLDDRSGGIVANGDLTNGLFAPISPDDPDRLGLYKPIFIARGLAQVDLTSHYCQPLR